jgi:hypothetical protein
MTKYCQHCKCENLDDAFWCVNCNTKIITNPVLYEKNQPTLYDTEREKNIDDSLSDRHHPKIFLKTVSIVCIIAIVCILVFALLHDRSFVFGYHEDLTIKCQINEDFWFDGNFLNTSEGWSFTLTKVKNYTLEGRILATKIYDKNNFPYDPCNIFSPIDLFIGIGDVQTNPGSYDYSITSFNHRVVTWYMNYDDINDYYYFRSHTGNNHIIPHNAEVLNTLANNISRGDVVILEGSLVNLYGTKGNQYWKWTTDTSIGNYNCEIILVDRIQILNG